MQIALGRIWIGANDKYGEDIIRYLGNDGATIPDDSSLWPLGQPRHEVANTNYDCVTVFGQSYTLSQCGAEEYFICELYPQV